MNTNETCQKSFNPYEERPEDVYEKENQKASLIMDSQIDNLRDLKTVDIKISPETPLKKGIYKISYIIPEILPNKHFTNVVKAIPVENEYKDVIFHKVDTMPLQDNSGTVVTAIFEIVTNPILASFIIYAIGSAIIGTIGTFVITSAQKLVNSITRLIPWTIGGLLVFWLIFRK